MNSLSPLISHPKCCESNKIIPYCTFFFSQINVIKLFLYKINAKKFGWEFGDFYFSIPIKVFEFLSFLTNEAHTTYKTELRFGLPKLAPIRPLLYIISIVCGESANYTLKNWMTYFLEDHYYFFTNTILRHKINLKIGRKEKCIFRLLRV